MIPSAGTWLSFERPLAARTWISTTDLQEEKLKIQLAEEDRALHIEDGEHLVMGIDASSDGNMCQTSIVNFFSEDVGARQTASSCRVPARALKEVLLTSYMYGPHVNVSSAAVLAAPAVALCKCQQ